MVMRESPLLVGIGVVSGIVLAFAANRLIATQLYGLAASDIPTLILATATIVAVVALAVYLPARRASLVDPLRAFRHE